MLTSVKSKIKVDFERKVAKESPSTPKVRGIKGNMQGEMPNKSPKSKYSMLPLYHIPGKIETG